MASISKRNDTKKTTYKVSYFIIDDLDRKKNTSRSFDNEKEAIQFKTEMDEMEEYSSSSPIVFEKKTLRWLVNDYITSYGVKKWTPVTYSKNKGLIDNYILPNIGETKLGRMNLRFINKFYDKLSEIKSVKTKDPLSPNLIISIHKVLTAIFNYAVENEILKKNPCNNAVLPDAIIKKKKIWEEDTLIDVLNTDSNKKMMLIVNIMFYGTLRPSELSGLKMSDVTFNVNEQGMALIKVDREFIRINKEAYEKSKKKNKVLKIYKSREDFKTFMAETTLKTKDSERQFWIPVEIAVLLKKEIDYIKTIKSGFTKEFKDSEFIFVNYKSGRPHDKDAIRDIFNRFIKDNNLEKITPHAMRHMSITHKIGITDLKSVQSDSGHSTMKQIEKTYSHEVDTRRIKAVKDLSNKFLKKENQDQESINNLSDDDILKIVKNNSNISEMILNLSKKQY